MELTRDQLDAIAAHAGERLREARAHGGGRYTLALAGGERLTLLAFESPAAAETALAALEMLRAEVDLPLPQVRAGDAAGVAAGVPWALVSELAGEPLSAALPRIPDEQLYKLGRRLGETAYRVHRLACARYGPLVGSAHAVPPADDERSYGLARMEAALGAAEARGLLQAAEGAAVRAWFDEHYQPVGAQAALVCGGLEPEALLVRQSGGAWSLSGLARWDRALGWSPAWEHALLFDAAGANGYFSLRVGYGNAYDQATRRAYEQVREHALRPYRALLSLERLAALDPAAPEAARRRAALMAIVGFDGGALSA
ncbi:MAG TPA: phosphotransferase [Roseiflexaceae bacterium]|nr:phosphotransferase [Roseiflexaceae bacterium]